MNRGLLNGASYSTLDLVYRGTTVPKKKYGRVKKMFRLGGSARKKLEPLFNLSTSYVADVSTEEEIYRREVLDQFGTMNISREEAGAGLGLNDIELRSIEHRRTSEPRQFDTDDGQHNYVRTSYGDLLVVVKGNRCKPAILTMHDLGVNHTAFLPFFNNADMKPLMMNFCVYHVNALGQEANSPSLPENFEYPSMDEQANMLNYVLAHFKIKDFIGFGVGAGANILARYALAYPSKVNALVLINCDSQSAGWIEWAYQKVNSRSLRTYGMTHGVLDYLMWHHFGRFAQERNPELVLLYRNYFYRHVNPVNLSMFINAYISRSDMNITRDGATVDVPLLNITGALSPHVDHTVTFNGRLNPNKSTWIKISDCAMVLEEQPSKVFLAFCLFLQGEGYAAPLSPTKLAAFRKLSEPGELAQPQRRPCRRSPVIRITENPISEAVVC